jgi:transposase
MSGRSNTALKAEIRILREENARLREMLEAINFRLAMMERNRFGRRSETVPGQQALDLATGLAVTESIEPSNDDEPDEDPPAPPRGGRKGSKQKRGGRLHIPDHIPTREERIEPDPSAVIGPNGERLAHLRDNVSVRLEYTPACFEAVRTIRPVYGIRGDDGPSVCAQAPAQIVSGGLAGDSVVAMVLCEKYDLHNPLYRQEDRCARAGIHIPRSSMANWVQAGTAVLAPVVEAMRQELLQAPVIGLDDTVIDRLAPGEGTTHTGRFWGYLGNDTMIVRYADTRSGQHPLHMLGDWAGPIIADAYSGHEGLYADGRRVHLPCWAHVRRKFYEAWKDGGDQRARAFLDDISLLAAIEKRLADSSPPERQRTRTQDARPVIARFIARCHRLQFDCTPKSPMGRAIGYARNLAERLPRYCNHGDAPMNNNALERLWKPVALGRKNYLFVGSEAGGHAAAIAYSIMLTCRQRDIEPYRYLTDTFAAHHRHDDPVTMTPATYAAKHGLAKAA